MNRNEIKVTLTQQQIRHVLREAEADTGIASVLSRGLKDRSQLMHAYVDLSNRYVSRSLLLGLMLLACFPHDDNSIGLKEIAARSRLPPSTVHRYLRTLVIAGLLEQVPETRKYQLWKMS
jgi:hypothetical protein